MRFSIITPVYNSAKFLPGLYEDLKRKYSRYQDFEWILINDCSPDNSTDVMEKIKNDNPPFPFKTIYLEKNHYGAMCTVTASKVAEGDYIIILDADDFLADDGLLIFHDLINRYQHNENFVGACGRCEDLEGNFLGTRFSEDEVYSNELYVRHVLKIKGEMFQCTKREVIQEYFYGIKPGYTNGWAWSRISQKYSWVYTNKVVRRYFTNNLDSVSHSPVVRFLYNRIHMDMDYMTTMRKYIRYDFYYWFQRALIVSAGAWLSKKVYIGYKQPWWVQITLAALIPVGGLLALAAVLKNGRKKYSIHA